MSQKRIKRRLGKQQVEGKDFRLLDEVRYIQQRAAVHDVPGTLYTYLVMAATSTKAPFPFLGKWKWKNAASTTQPSFPVPQQGSTQLTQEGDSIHYVAVGIYSDRQTRHTESTFRFDGNSYPVIGGTLGDALSAHQLDSHSLQVTVTRSGALSAKVKITISPDGDVMTTEWEAIVPHSANITWTTVSERQTDD